MKTMNLNMNNNLTLNVITLCNRQTEGYGIFKKNIVS